MLYISSIENVYFIRYTGHRLQETYTCRFEKHLVPDMTPLLDTLGPAPEGHSSCFFLDRLQQNKIANIFRKMHREKDSGYIYTDYLQHTYLAELIHFIVKLKEKGGPDFSFSLN